MQQKDRGTTTWNLELGNKEVWVQSETDNVVLTEYFIVWIVRKRSLFGGFFTNVKIKSTVLLEADSVVTDSRCKLYCVVLRPPNTSLINGKQFSMYWCLLLPCTSSQWVGEFFFPSPWLSGNCCSLAWLTATYKCRTKIRFLQLVSCSSVRVGEESLLLLPVSTVFIMKIFFIYKVNYPFHSKDMHYTLGFYSLLRSIETLDHMKHS